MSKVTFTGQIRKRSTRRSVRVADRAARLLIAVGGIGTILAVCLIITFLVWVVLPLFESGSLENAELLPLEGEGGASNVREIRMDEYRTMAWFLHSSGLLSVCRMDTGEVIHRQGLFDGTPLENRTFTASAFAPGARVLERELAFDAAFGFDDGSVVVGMISFRTEFFEVDDMPPALRGLAPGEVAPFRHEKKQGEKTLMRSGMVQVTPERQFRFQWVEASFRSPATIEPSSPITLIDLTRTVSGQVLAALTGDGRILVEEVRTKENWMTGELTTTLEGGGFSLETSRREPTRNRPEPPSHLLLSEQGAYLYLVWDDGNLIRFNTRDRMNAKAVEYIDILPEEDLRLTAVAFLIGKSTLVFGDSSGRIQAWFPVIPDEPQTSDGRELRRGHSLPGNGQAVTSFSASGRARLLAAGYEGGMVRLFHVTSENLVAEKEIEPGATVSALCLAPRNDGLLAVCGPRLWRCDIDAEHPDVTLGSLFLPTWYEGHPEPGHDWQSTGLTDAFEPKLGIAVLVFGTLKATLYSMLFGLPIALLAAIFASEFLHPRVKAKIKPTIEVMASLPSVVLGFLAALVIAPFIDEMVPAVLSSFVTIPFAFLLGAHLWQLLPQGLSVRWRSARFPVICLCLPFGVLLAALIGPGVQRWLFAGDIRLWLDGRIGGGWGGWMILTLPLCGVLAGAVLYWRLGPWFRGLTAGLGRGACAWLDLGRFALAATAALLFAYLLSHLLGDGGFGWDPRGSYVDTYIPRNALVVGFIMGFAIIPIVFTIAEDALSAVPEHLRSASLGAGATPWQTAARIVIPTAMSGLFSAMMIGLGRAVGETMIVLMAAGNTAIMDWNVFNGFRTLSANLATELPEAVKDSTHYRTLFLAALVLFIMTFLLNTVAEVVRLRFRKRAFEL